MITAKAHRFGEIWPEDVIPQDTVATANELLALPWLHSYTRSSDFCGFEFDDAAGYGADNYGLLLVRWRDDRKYVVAHLSFDSADEARNFHI